MLMLCPTLKGLIHKKNNRKTPSKVTKGIYNHNTMDKVRKWINTTKSSKISFEMLPKPCLCSELDLEIVFWSSFVFCCISLDFEKTFVCLHSFDPLFVKLFLLLFLLNAFNIPFHLVHASHLNSLTITTLFWQNFCLCTNFFSKSFYFGCFKKTKQKKSQSIWLIFFCWPINKLVAKWFRDI